MKPPVGMRNRAYLAGMMSLLFVATAVGLWGLQTGRLVSLGDTLGKELIILVQSKDDWTKGAFEKTEYTKDALRLAALPAPAAPTSSPVPTTSTPQPTPTTTTASPSPSPSPTQSTTSPVVPAKVLTAQGTFTVINRPKDSADRNRLGTCTAVAPTNWTGTAASQNVGTEFPLSDPNGSLGVKYAHFAYLTGWQAYGGIFTDLYSADPAVSVRAYARNVLNLDFADASTLNYTNEYNQAMGDYTLRSLESSRYKVIAFYRQLAGDGWSHNYQNVIRLAFVPLDQWAGKGVDVARIAASLNCVQQFKPTESYFVTAAPTRSGSTTTDDQNGSDSGYNPQLGTEYVRDSLGNNYVVDPSTDWSATGPDGPGYYVATSGGNSHELLQPGRWD